MSIIVKCRLLLSHQVAHHFADLHDTPGRLVARGLVHGLVEWRSSRAFFFARLSRRLVEQDAVQRLRRAHNPTVIPSASTPHQALYDPFVCHKGNYLCRLLTLFRKGHRFRVSCIG